MSYVLHCCIESQLSSVTSTWSFVCDVSKFILCDSESLDFFCDLFDGTHKQAFTPPYGNRGFPDDITASSQQLIGEPSIYAGWLAFLEYQCVDWDESLDAAIEITNSTCYDIIPTRSTKFKQLFYHLDSVSQKRWLREGSLDIFGKKYQQQHFSRWDRMTEGWKQVFDLLEATHTHNQGGDARVIAWYNW